MQVAEVMVELEGFVASIVDHCLCAELEAKSRQLEVLLSAHIFTEG